MTTGYRRYPHIHDKQVVFVADDDLWVGETSGGRAFRLTQGEDAPRDPRFSPSGQHIAYASAANGGMDLYVTSLDGGSRRLTWLSARRIYVSGWLDSEHVVIASAHASIGGGEMWLYSVSLDGQLRLLPYGVGRTADVCRKGVVISTTFGTDPAMWKRYRGASAMHLWV